MGNVPRDVSSLKFILISHLFFKTKYKALEVAFVVAIMISNVVFKASLT